MTTTYYGDGEGNWIKRVWAEQCEHEIFLSERCQGVKGHEGNHWCYKPDGSYAWDSGRKDLKPHEAAGGWTPPGHKSWISPVDMADHYYVSYYEDSDVTDPELIDRLNREELEDGESMDLPVTDPKLLDALREIGDND